MDIDLCAPDLTGTKSSLLKVITAVKPIVVIENGLSFLGSEDAYHKIYCYMYFIADILRKVF